MGNGQNHPSHGPMDLRAHPRIEPDMLTPSDELTRKLPTETGLAVFMQSLSADCIQQ
jgi:hypothetical protein